MFFGFFRSGRTLAPLALCLLLAATANAQNQEIGGSLGALLGSDRTSKIGSQFTLNPDLALGVDYEHRILRRGPLALYAGIDFAASEVRTVSSSDRTLTRDVATIYLTPNLMVKFHEARHFTPWVAAGGGVAVYEQSLFRIDGQRNPATRDVTHGAFTFGGGIDLPVWRFLAVRGQVRDFYTGSPSYNTPVSGGQNNVLAGAALVVRWGR